VDAQVREEEITIGLGSPGNVKLCLKYQTLEIKRSLETRICL